MSDEGGGGAATQPLSPVATSSFPITIAADSTWGWLIPSVAFLTPIPLKGSSYKVGWDSIFEMMADVDTAC